MSHRQLRQSFTLVELLVSIAILSFILVILLSMTLGVSKLIRSVSGQTAEYARSRDALDAISRRIGSAELNTYWDVATNASGDPSSYCRQSELRFLAGPTVNLVTAAGETATALPGSAIFFQAPTGVFSSTASNGYLKGALNTWGYYVEYGSDKNFRPGFLTGKGVPERYRFRLFELLEPSDNLTIYNYTSGLTAGLTPKNLSYSGKDWFQTAFNNRAGQVNASAPNARLLADDVIAAVFSCQLPPADNSFPLALSYSTNSPATDGDNFTYDTTYNGSTPNVNPKNQLPPIVEVTLVCIDEKTAAHYNWTATAPDFGQQNLLVSTVTTHDQLDAQINTIIANLQAKGIQARTFRTSVGIRAAKWSTLQ